MTEKYKNEDTTIDGVKIDFANEWVIWENQIQNLLSVSILKRLQAQADTLALRIIDEIKGGI
jgi:hypothetical protein